MIRCGMGNASDKPSNLPQVFWSTPGVEIKIIAAVGERKPEDRQHLEPVQESVVLAMMEGAGMINSAEESLALMMEGARDQMSPEELEKQRTVFARKIQEGRHEAFVNLDPDHKTLLERAARGEVVMIRGGGRRH